MPFIQLNHSDHTEGWERPHWGAHNLPWSSALGGSLSLAPTRAWSFFTSWEASPAFPEDMSVLYTSILPSLTCLPSVSITFHRDSNLLKHVKLPAELDLVSSVSLCVCICLSVCLSLSRTSQLWKLAYVINHLPVTNCPLLSLTGILLGGFILRPITCPLCVFSLDLSGNKQRGQKKKKTLNRSDRVSCFEAPSQQLITSSWDFSLPVLPLEKIVTAHLQFLETYKESSVFRYMHLMNEFQ